MFKKRSEKGQTSVEYLLLIALLTMIASLIYKWTTPRTAGVIDEMRGAFQNTVKTGEMNGKEMISFKTH
ncbi:MAG: class III signal peptide-containing protein [Deltaproteobacteria bacterium]|nr:class III signal peptide-containing protein [Deltaproteobacteria bacterium]